MNYKEKYEQALGRAKVINPGTADYEVAVKIFPELKESESEKIRKELIHFVRRQIECHDKPNAERDEIFDSWISWLEKQGEQKPTDKVEPKFKVGDWIVWDNKISCHIDNIYQGKESLMYTITDTNNMTRSYSVKGFDNNAHLWTIQDAKKGDILTSDKIVLIVDHIGDFEGESTIYSWYFADSNKFYGMGPKHPDKWSIEGFHPATKEQCDFLFQKMKESGYEWDAEKKELKKIEQKPAWSEEDEYNLNWIINDYERASQTAISSVWEGRFKLFVDWLKSLKERMKGE